LTLSHDIPPATGEAFSALSAELEALKAADAAVPSLQELHQEVIDSGA
jgi:hypothetical protein